MLQLGVIGWPVTHSLSPVMQQAGLDALGIAGSYDLLPIPPESFAAGIDDLVARGFTGWNCTVPHKGRMCARVDVKDAGVAGDSVNTVAVINGQLHGWSTDGYGLETALGEAFSLAARGSRIMLWGTGGAARAVADHLVARGTALTLVNRTLAKAQQLAEILIDRYPDAAVEVIPISDQTALAAAAAAADVVVQCTSIGLKPDDPSAIPETVLRAANALYDMIYKHTQTLALANRFNIPTADGRGMLLHQGVRSLEIWTGQPGPVAAMRQALNQALASP